MAAHSQDWWTPPSVDANRLAVSVPTRNRREKVVSALGPIVAQLRDGDELLVVDDGSTDGTQDAVASWLRERFPAGRVVSQPGGGVSAARNAALRETTASIVCFVDDDIRPDPGWLEQMRKTWESCSERTAAIGGPIQGEWPDERPPWLTDHLLYVLALLDLGDERALLDQRPGLGYVWGANMSVRREAALEVGGFDAERGSRPVAPFDRGEEEELQRRLASAGWEIVYEPTAGVRHLLPPERLTKQAFRRFFREQGLLEAARGRPRRDGATALAASVARGTALTVLRRPQAAVAWFAAVREWAVLTGPRRPKTRQDTAQ
jgi:glucosyl-dolichyl phosphate glucuronosyltransferase